MAPCRPAAGLRHRAEPELIRSRLARLWLALACLLPPVVAPAQPVAQPEAQPQRAELIGTLRLTHDAPWFGGFSGIEMAPGGDAMLLISDRTRWARAMITRENGVATQATGWNSLPILGPDGGPQPRGHGDSEGLARLPGGRICISYEGVPRVECHAGIRAPAEPLPGYAPFEKLGRNSALEALAADGLGRLYTLPETTLDPDGLIPVWRWDGSRWSVVLQLQDQRGFRPVGADVLDDHLYLLLRHFSPLGFNSRLLRIPLSGGTADLLLQTGPGTHDNLEGLSVWRNADGDIIASMISDDNRNWFQRSELVEYRLPEPPARRDAAALPRADAPLASRPRSQ